MMKNNDEQMKNKGNMPLTLEEALKNPCKHRDMALTMEPMDNFSSTPGVGRTTRPWH
jgi:hypothetical protein